jgi:hypothetical protein
VTHREREQKYPITPEAGSISVLPVRCEFEGDFMLTQDDINLLRYILIYAHGERDNPPSCVTDFISRHPELGELEYVGSGRFVWIYSNGEQDYF